MKHEDFFNDNKYKMANDSIKILINNLIEIFEDKCIEKFYPVWRGNEGSTRVFVLKLRESLMSKEGKKRENIITVRLKIEQLDIEVYNGIYCKGNEFSYSLNVMENGFSSLCDDINNLFIPKIINE